MSSFYSDANRNQTHAQPYTEIPTVVAAGNAANEHIENGKNICSSPWCHTPVSGGHFGAGRRSHSPERFLQAAGKRAHDLPKCAVDLSQEVLPWRTGGVVAYSWVERDTKVWGKGRGCLCVSRRVTKSSGEEVINVKSIIRLEIRAYDADTYVKVGWLPGWRRRRKRERETRQQQWHNRAYHGTEGTRLKYQTVINPVQERGVDMWRSR